MVSLHIALLDNIHISPVWRQERICFYYIVRLYGKFKIPEVIIVMDVRPELLQLLPLLVDNAIQPGGLFCLRCGEPSLDLFFKTRLYKSTLACLPSSALSFSISFIAFSKAFWISCAFTPWAWSFLASSEAGS